MRGRRQEACYPAYFIMEFNTHQSKPIREKLVSYHQSFPMNWCDELENYIVHGFEPGSFHRNLYANNLAGATQTSDSLNEWGWITYFIEFLCQTAPAECWGNNEKVERWLKLSKTTRYKICHENGLLLTPQEATWDILENSE